MKEEKNDVEECEYDLNSFIFHEWKFCF